MHQSPLKNLPRQRDRQAEIDPLEDEAQRRGYRAATPKARKFHLREDTPRAERRERQSGPGRPGS